MKKTVVGTTLEREKIIVAVEDLRFRVCVYGVIVHDDKILLTPWRDGWDFPGGGMEVDETITETLDREIHEETGIQKDQIIL